MTLSRISGLIQRGALAVAILAPAFVPAAAIAQDRSTYEQPYADSAPRRNRVKRDDAYRPADEGAGLGTRFLGHIERDLSDQGGKWCATSLCPIEAFRSFFPNCPASGVPLQKTEYVSGALYACGVQGFETVRPTMVQLRTARKAPLEMARIVLSKVGILMLIQAIWRRKQPAFLEQVLTRALGVKTKIYLDADAPSCMDFDTPEEWEACVRHAATISESK